MKKNIILLSMLALCTVGVTETYGAGIADLLATIKKKGSPKEICKKASFFSGVFTIRSGGGVICKNKIVAAVAEKICPDAASDYMDSGCHKEAVKALAGKTPAQVTEEAKATGTSEEKQLVEAAG